MEKYRNIAGNSGVNAYEAGSDFIKIKFIDGSVYLYTDRNPGKTHVENMKKLARQGRGLSSYISRYVRVNYEAKLV
jgi:hypothetical protein